MKRASRGAARLGPAEDQGTFSIAERPNNYHYEVDKGPDSKTTKSEELQYACSCFPNIEPVDSKDAQEPTKQESYKPRLFRVGVSHAVENRGLFLLGN